MTREELERMNFTSNLPQDMTDVIEKWQAYTTANNQ